MCWIEADLRSISEHAPMPDQGKIAGPEDLVPAGAGRDRRKDRRAIEKGRRGAVEPAIGSDGGDLRHEEVKRQPAAPMRRNNAHLWKGSEECQQVAHRDIALAGIAMPHRLAGMGK